MEASDFIVLIAFGLAWWLGLYLLGRDLRNPQLRFTGLGLATLSRPGPGRLPSDRRRP